MKQMNETSNEHALPAESLAVPGCPGCQRLLKPIEKLEAEMRELRALVIKLQAQLGQNSSNSSKPPSSDPPHTKPQRNKEPTGRKPGGQAGHPGHHRVRQPPEKVTRTVDYFPNHCDTCGRRLSRKPGVHDPKPHWHQVFELPLMIIEIIEHLGHGRICTCGHVTFAQIPESIRRYTFGPNIAALLSYLSGRGQASKRMLQEMMAAIFGVSLSLGSIPNIEREVREALATGYEEVKTAVSNAAVKHVDETGWFEKSRLCWLWAAATKTAVCFQIQASRGRDGLKNFLGETVRGIIHSDRWGGYARLLLSQRQLCWAHLKRDFQKLIDSGNTAAQKTGRAGLQVAEDLFTIWHEYKNDVFGRRALQSRMAVVSRRLKRVLKHGRDGPDAATIRFCRRILKLFPALWTFVYRPGVEPTNNHVERQLRPGVMWRRRSFGNHSAAGCRFTERILTVVQTLRLQNRPVLPYLREAIIAHRNGMQPASPLIYPLVG